MDNVEWHTFFYNGLETNIEATRCGRVRRVPKHWMKIYKPTKEVYFSTELKKIYFKVSFRYKSDNLISTHGYMEVHNIVASIFLNHIVGNYRTNGIVVDHIDSNPRNNHIDNLRLVTQRENLSKERTIKSGLPVGVTYHKKHKKYRAKMVVKGKTKWFGHYDNIGEASEVYQDALKALNEFLENTDNKGNTDEWHVSYRAKMKGKPSKIGEQLAIQFN